MIILPLGAVTDQVELVEPQNYDYIRAWEIESHESVGHLRGRPPSIQFF